MLPSLAVIVTLTRVFKSRQHKNCARPQHFDETNLLLYLSRVLCILVKTNASLDLSLQALSPRVVTDASARDPLTERKKLFLNFTDIILNKAQS